MIRETEGRKKALETVSEELGFEVKPSQVFDFGVKHITDSDILKAAHSRPIDIKFIEANEGHVNWAKVIYIGLESECDRIKRFKALQTYTDSFNTTQKANKPTKPLKFILNEALETEGEVSTWSELVDYCAKAGHVINARSPNDVPVTTPYYYERAWLSARTSNKFTLNSLGQIRYY